jgi:hypothetical protein
MSVMRPPPIYIRASCVRLTQVQRCRPERGYGGSLRWRGGAVAEWLGRGLQSLVQRFESARRLSFPAKDWSRDFIPSR